MTPNGDSELDTRLSRRGLLATVGASALAGCGGFGGDDSLEELDASEFRDIPASPEPPTVPRLPITVSDTFTVEQVEAAQRSLAAVPTPLGRDEVPNGHVRDHVYDALREARSSLTAASQAPTPFLAVAELTGAREYARYAAGTWAAIEGDLTLANVDEAVGDHADRRRAVVADHEYVGTDPIRATVTHVTIDRWLAGAEARGHHGNSDHPRVLRIGDAASALEDAQAYLDAAAHLRSRFRSALPEDPPSLADRFETAVGTLSDLVQSRRRSLPDPDAARAVGGDGETARTTAWVLDDLYDDATRIDPGDVDDPTDGILYATEALAAIAAFRTIRSTVDDGERFGVPAATEIRRQRTAARTRIKGAVRESDAPRLARFVLAGLAREVAWADRELADQWRNGPTRGTVRDEYTTYVRAEAVAAAMPSAIDRAAKLLRTG